MDGYCICGTGALHALFTVSFSSFFLHLQATSAVQELAIAAYAGALTNKREPT